MVEENIIIGIDLGTTNSAAYVCKNRKTEVIPTVEGYDYFPSVVAVNENGDLLVGHYAKKQKVSNSKNTCSEFKLQMGTNDKIPFNGEYKRPEELSALILSKIKLDAETYLSKSIKKAVISVPAKFNDDARQATKNAAKIAGFEKVKLINEPTAACLTYGSTKKISGKVLVFDLGGGTLDITIGEYKNSELKVLSTSGAQVGGRDITVALFDFVKNQFEKEHGENLSDYVTDDYDPLADLYEAVENAKIELSVAQNTNIHISSIIVKLLIKRINLDVNVTRSKLNELAEPIIKRCEEVVKQALLEAKLISKDIDYLVFVGGPTKMPLLRKRIEKALDLTAAEGINPMLCVAQGASQVCCGGEVKPVPVIQDINPRTLSIVTINNSVEKVVDKNEDLPATGTSLITTSYDNQTFANITIVEGEESSADKNHALKTFRLNGIPKMPEGDPDIQVNIKVNKDGIIDVSAIELTSGVKISGTIESDKRMSSSEIKKATKDNERLISGVVAKRNNSNILDNANDSILKAKSLIRDFEENISISNKNELNEIINDLEVSIEKDYNPNLIKIITNNLLNLINEIEDNLE